MMNFRPRRSFLFTMLALVGTAAIACSTASSSTAPSTSGVNGTEVQPPTSANASIADTQPAPEPTQSVSSSEVDSSAPVASEAGYDPNKTMFDLFPGFGLAGSQQTRDALALVLEQRDTSQVAIMVEMLRFLPSMNSREETAVVLRELTGESFNGEQWQEWTEWYGRNADDFPPPDLPG